MITGMRTHCPRKGGAQQAMVALMVDPLSGCLFLAAPKGLKVAEIRDGSPQAGALETLIRNAITTYQLDIVSLDPFIKSHSVEENGNNAIDYVCTLLVSIAIDLNCAVDLPHHASKGVATPGDANRGRGASSMKDAARLVYTLTPMSTDEAKKFGLSEAERRNLIRLDSGKVNIAPPAREAKWFRLVGVRLENGTADYPKGDEIQTVERWELPDLWRGLSTHVINLILDEIEAGFSNGVRYSSSPRQDVDRAAWRVIQTHAPDRTPEQCQPIIAAWLRSGLLSDQDYEDPTQRKTRKGLFVDAGKRPGDVV
jgi:hypothetical protein